ncbi:MAG: J domain-containing protein [Thermodesulfobacteria bacterium]|nr:J domain-containing protein [Thermodesulfobacteriota bacterium]
MYLAIERGPQGQRFILRHSVQDKDGIWVSLDVFDLGRDPEEYVEYIDERVFLISPEVEEALADKGVEYEYEELEEIFWPFIDPYIRQTIEDFGGIRGRGGRKRKRYTQEELGRMQASIHAFDKRRMLFLKLLQINIEPLMDHPLIFLNRLLDKSRDELENNFRFMEMDLRPWEMKAYIYCIFGLPARFAPRLSRFIPDAQDRDLMDEFFMEELCSLNSDPTYIDAGARPRQASGLHPYLRRYAIQYFDFVFKGPGLGRSAGSRGPWRPPATARDDEHLFIMGLSRQEFDQMNEQEFVRYYRRRAQELHPDKGGDHDAFIRLKDAFEILIIKKRW